MGVYPRKLKNGKVVWCYRIVFKGRDIRKTVGPLKRQAIEAERRKRIELVDGVVTPHKKKEIRFKDLAELYMKIHSKPNKKAWKRDAVSIKHLNGFFKNRFVSEINSLIIEEYKLKRLNEVCKATINQELACLKSIFTKGILWEKVDENPAKETKLFKTSSRRMDFFSVEQVRKILVHTKPYQLNIIKLAFYTGLRPKNLFELKWADVDMKRGIMFFKTSKSGKSLKIPLSEQSVSLLRELKCNRKGQYVLHKENGKPYKGGVNRGFKAILQRAHIHGDYTFYTIRHSFASHLVMDGVPLKTVAFLMGHTDTKMVDKVYGHLAQKHIKGAVDRLAQKI